jgi:hypothetical protein
MKLSSLRSYMGLQARKRGLKIRTRMEGDKAIVIQAYKPEGK